MKVTICVVTYRRPDGLTRLLESLQRMTFRSSPPDIEIIVVDNDPDQSARTVRDRLTFTNVIRWIHEPRRGIPQARNAALAAVDFSSDFAAFIDDDEEADPSWLDELLSVQRTFDADVVTGPVIPKYAEGVPSWLIRGRFFEASHRPTGCRMNRAFTNNVLLKTGVLRQFAQQFDERMALTGGSDAHFFLRVAKKGFKIVWADSALVLETIPLSRMTLRWLMRRHYRVGTATAAIRSDLAPGFSTRAVLKMKGVVWLLLGLLRMFSGVILGRAGVAWGLQGMAYGVGLIAGVLGHRFEEYRTVHGK